jgi:hypothetical protein
MRIWIFILLSICFIYSCRKEQGCVQLSSYQNTYILRDSIAYLYDSTSIVADTISIKLDNSGGNCFINSFGPENSFLVTSGCANKFTLDTGSFGFGTYFGNGSITNNGQNISLYVWRIPTPVFFGDTLVYYCSAVRL